MDLTKHLVLISATSTQQQEVVIITFGVKVDGVDLGLSAGVNLLVSQDVCQFFHIVSGIHDLPHTLHWHATPLSHS